MYLQAGAAFASEQGLETDLQDDPRQGIRRIHGCCTGQIEFNVTERSHYLYWVINGVSSGTLGGRTD